MLELDGLTRHSPPTCTMLEILVSQAPPRCVTLRLVAARRVGERRRGILRGSHARMRERSGKVVQFNSPEYVACLFSDGNATLVGVLYSNRLAY
jgi:hypothetical protein